MTDHFVPMFYCILLLVMIGSFKNFYHNIGGDVYALDSNNILIKGFTYDGEGPDAFFLAGTSGKPSRLHGDVVLPYPYEVSHSILKISIFFTMTNSHDHIQILSMCIS